MNIYWTYIYMYKWLSSWWNLRIGHLNKMLRDPSLILHFVHHKAFSLIICNGNKNFTCTLEHRKYPHKIWTLSKWSFDGSYKCDHMALQEGHLICSVLLPPPPLPPTNPACVVYDILIDIQIRCNGHKRGDGAELSSARGGLRSKYWRDRSYHR